MRLYPNSERLLGAQPEMNDGEVYRQVEALGRQVETGLDDIFGMLDPEAIVARQGAAFCVYFMDHLPAGWHDPAQHHDFQLDETMRRKLIEEDIYVFPLATKQCSISASHRPEHIAATLETVGKVLAKVPLTARRKDPAPVRR